MMVPVFPGCQEVTLTGGLQLMAACSSEHPLWTGFPCKPDCSSRKKQCNQAEDSHPQHIDHAHYDGAYADAHDERNYRGDDHAEKFQVRHALS